MKHKTLQIRETTVVGFKQLADYFSNKKVTKKGRINFTVKQVEKDFTIIMLDILRQVSEKKIYGFADKLGLSK